MISLRKILLFASAVEIATGAGLVFLPALVVGLLLRGDVSELVLMVARVLGITLISLALACWPRRQDVAGSSAAFHGMLAYNSLIALLLTYAAAALHIAGPLLWPTVLLHGAVALLLLWRRRDLL